MTPDETATPAPAAPSFEIFGRHYAATMSTAEAAELLGCSAERLQQQRGKGTLPLEPLQLGRRLRWPTLKVAEALGVAVDPQSAQLSPTSTPRRERRGRRRPCRWDEAGAA